MRIFLNRRGSVTALDVLTSVSVTQRELLKAVQLQVIAGSGLTFEMAELLVELSLPEHLDGEGYISFRELKNALGYSGGLLSRRISSLCDCQWAETKRAEANLTRGVHGNSQKVKITQLGRNKIAPVWRRFELLAEQLLDGVSQQDRESHHRLNQRLCDKLRPPSLLVEDGSVAPAPLKSASDPEREFLD